MSIDSITNWENGRSVPQIKYNPKIAKFLGYNPVQIAGNTFGYRLKRYRIERGLSCKVLGKLLRVDASTIRSWETEKFKPSKKLRDSIAEILLIL